ncbi:MAG: DUF371 domain-containing protein [Candidatus Bathyarchaeota archaeon]|nr:DUF371 domain-containing protein [Candidatus Bathyarchaeota archaeon]
MPVHEVVEVVFGFGHEKVQATHKSTVEFTKEADLTWQGDCILVVSADKGAADLSTEFKELLRSPQAKLTVQIQVGNLTEQLQAQGSPQLSLTHPNEMVIRKSLFTSERTLAINADKAANDLSRELAKKLQNPKQQAKITLTVRA